MPADLAAILDRWASTVCARDVATLCVEIERLRVERDEARALLREALPAVEADLYSDGEVLADRIRAALGEVR